MLKRDHPKFKGNSISATGASKSECHETHRVKVFHCLRKKVLCRTSSRSITCSRGITRNSKVTEFRQPGHRSRNAAKLTESKSFTVCGRKSYVEQVAEALHAQEGSPEIHRQLNFGNRGIEVGMPRNSPSQSVSPFGKKV